MPFSWDNMPYTNFHELNLDWFIKKFNEIFEEWESLYTTLTQWKEDTDTDLAQWKRDTLADMDAWENDLLDALDTWKRETGEDIGEWETGVIGDLNDWKQDFLDAYDTMYKRVDAIVSNTEDMVENLAEPFSTSKAYSASEYVVYNGVLYVFIADHAAGAWNASDVQQTTAMRDIEKYKDDLYFWTSEPKSFHVNANASHSADNDQLAVNISTGTKFLVYFHRESTNNIQAWGYGDQNEALFVSSEKSGHYYFTADTNFNAIGITVSLTAIADDYIFGVVTENDEMYKFFETVDRAIDNETNITVHEEEINNIADKVFNYTLQTMVTSVAQWRLNDDDGNCHSDANYQLVKYSVSSGDILKIVSDDKFQFQSALSVPSSGPNTRIGETYGIGTFLFKVPVGATYLIISTQTTSNHSVSLCTTKLDASTQLYNETYATEPHKIRVAAGVYHSADNDRLAVDIKSGEKFIINFHRKYTNNIQFWAYTPEGQPNYAIAGSSRIFDKIMCIASADIEYIGLTITANTYDDDYYFSVSGESSIFYQEELASNTYAKNYDYKTKVSQFAALYENVGLADSFVYFTDPHLLSAGDTESFKKMFDDYTKVIGGFYNQTSTGFILCGGDWLEYNDTPADALYKLNIAQGRMKDIADTLYYPVKGNHDNNQSGTQALSQDAVNAVMFPNQGKAYYSFKTPNCTYYVLDTGSDWNTTMDSYRWEQIEWLATKLKNENPARCVIIGHIIRNVNADSDITPMMLNVNSIIGAFNTKGNVTLNGNTYDYSTCTGKIYYVLGGHSHLDRIDTTYNVPFIVRTTTKTTLPEPTFDLILCDFTNEKLYFVRVGYGASSTAETVNL